MTCVSGRMKLKIEKKERPKIIINKDMYDCLYMCFRACSASAGPNVWLRSHVGV
jgi:hypothetical protein